MNEPKSPSLRKVFMPNSRRDSRTKSRFLQAWKNSYKPASRLITKSGPIGKLAMLSQRHRVDSSPPPQVLAPGHIPAPWTSPRLDTAPKSEALPPNKRRSVAGTITCAYTVAHLAIGLRNAPTNDQGESPLLLPPPLREAYLFLLLYPFCLLLLLPLPKSSMRQKTNSRCK